jgi:hypothetical protein
MTQDENEHIVEQLRPLARSVDEFTLDPTNARIHDEDNLEVIRTSLVKYGQRQPIVVQKDGMIVRAGNARLIVARKLGWKTIAAVVIDEPDLAATAYGIIDNRSSELAEWSDETLAKLLASIQAEDPDILSATGFDESELEELLADIAGEPDVIQDDIPEPPVEPVAKRGQLWALGDHRVLCGDSTQAEDVARLPKFDAVVTDPPYGISIVGKSGTAGNFPGTAAPRHEAPPIVGDDKPFDPSHLLDLAPALVIWGGNHFADKLPASSKWLVWDKKDGAFRESSLGDCEIAWTNLPGAARLLHHTWQGMYRKGAGERAPRVHPTQKPVDLMAWCIEQTKTEGAVADMYLGSGTTLIAAEQLGRTCYGIEIEPRYIDVIIQRWEKLTGEKAELLEESNA